MVSAAVFKTVDTLPPKQWVWVRILPPLPVTTMRTFLMCFHSVSSMKTCSQPLCCEHNFLCLAKDYVFRCRGTSATPRRRMRLKMPLLSVVYHTKRKRRSRFPSIQNLTLRANCVIIIYIKMKKN